MEMVGLRGVEHLDKLLTTAAFVCKAAAAGGVADGSIMNWGSLKPLSEESYSLSLALVMVEWPSSSGKGARPTEDEPWTTTLNLHEEERAPLSSPLVFLVAATGLAMKRPAEVVVVVVLLSADLVLA